MYNNDTGLYEFDENVMNADWYEDVDRSLYIVPKSDFSMECEGPDNSIMDAINEARRDHGSLAEADRQRLNLEEISTRLKRFSKYDGYYHA